MSEMTNSGKKRSTRCKACKACLRELCGECGNCLDNPKFGGPNIRKQTCVYKRCAQPIYKTYDTVQEKKAKNNEKYQKKKLAIMKSDAYFRNIQKTVIPAPSPVSPTSVVPTAVFPTVVASSPNSTMSKLTTNAELNISKVKENGSSGYVSIGQGYTQQATKANTLKPKNENKFEQKGRVIKTYPHGNITNSVSRVPDTKRVEDISPIPVKRRKVDSVSTDDFDTSLMSHLLENMDGDSVVNIDKMFNVNHDDVGVSNVFLEGAITKESVGGENDSGYLDESETEETVQKKLSLDEFGGDIGENDLIKFLDREDIILAFIGIFHDANLEEKISLMDQVLVPCAEEVQDKIMTHLFRSVQKRKFGKKSNKRDEKITVKTAAELLQNRKPSQPPGPSQPYRPTKQFRLSQPPPTSQLSRPSGPFQRYQSYQSSRPNELSNSKTAQSSIPFQPPGPSQPFQTYQPSQPSAPSLPPQSAQQSSKPKPAMSLLVCDCRIYRTTNQDKLKKHIEAVHGGVTHHEWQTCGECEHEFKYWDDLKVHIGKEHSQKPHKSLSEKYVSKESDAKDPLEIPAGPKTLVFQEKSNFSCSTCRRHFLSKADLCIHREEQEECRFTCKECPETFTTERTMMDHIFQH